MLSRYVFALFDCVVCILVWTSVLLLLFYLLHLFWVWMNVDFGMKVVAGVKQSHPFSRGKQHRNHSQ